MSSPSTINPLLLGQFASFQSRFGIWRLRTSVMLQRLAWRCAVSGADVAKRAIDIAGAAAALFVLFPVFCVVALIIKLEDGGPIFFAQTRVGRFGREFKMYKFRSMRTDAEKRLASLLAANQHQKGVTFKIKDDPRITRIGKWIRRFSVDELPQFFNVLIGDMALVGPRPPVPREVALYTLADRRRLYIKPGITCIWQVSGRSEIDFPGQVQLDVNYIETQSLKQDLRILARTLPAVLWGPGAY